VSVEVAVIAPPRAKILGVSKSGPVVESADGCPAATDAGNSQRHRRTTVQRTSRRRGGVQLAVVISVLWPIHPSAVEHLPAMRLNLGCVQHQRLRTFILIDWQLSTCGNHRRSKSWRIVSRESGSRRSPNSQSDWVGPSSASSSSMRTRASAASRLTIAPDFSG